MAMTDLQTSSHYGLAQAKLKWAWDKISRMACKSQTLHKLQVYICWHVELQTFLHHRDTFGKLYGSIPYPLQTKQLWGKWISKISLRPWHAMATRDLLKSSLHFFVELLQWIWDVYGKVGPTTVSMMTSTCVFITVFFSLISAITSMISWSCW